MASPSVRVAPITDADVAAVAAFLHEHLNERIAPSAWARAMTAPWQVEAPNHGFHLRSGDDVLGAYLALYSTRTIAGRTERFCNLAAWCVLDEHRARSVRLIRSLLGQPGYHYVDLSPSGNVIALNERLGFQHLDTTTSVVPNLGGLVRRNRAVELTARPDRLRAALEGEARQRYLDHESSPAVIHLLVLAEDRPCHLMFRRDRRKGLPLFGSLLHAGDPAILEAAWPAVSRWLLVRHRIPFTLVQTRVAGHRPSWSVTLRNPRPKMFRSDTLRAEQFDELYSELTELPW